MSVVAVKVYDNEIKIAADSIMCRGWSKDTKGDFHKIGMVNDMLIGTVGSAAEGSLMFHFAETHKPRESTERSVLEYMREFSKWKDDMNAGSGTSNSYILVYEGKPFLIEGHLVYEITKYDAIGAGEDYANTALYLGHSPKKAVKAACDLCCFVAEPILEFSMPR